MEGSLYVREILLYFSALGRTVHFAVRGKLHLPIEAQWAEYKELTARTASSSMHRSPSEGLAALAERTAR